MEWNLSSKVFGSEYNGRYDISMHLKSMADTIKGEYE
jgi:hypothetical protein